MAWNYAQYVPSAEQWSVHNCPARLKLVGGGVGAGKSYLVAMEILRHIGTPGGLIWIIGPTYELANPEFDYVLDICRGLGIVDENTVTESNRGGRKFKLKSQYGGCEVATKSATNVEAIAGRRPDMLAATEAAQQPYEMLYKLLERAMERDAPVIMAGTFEGSFGWYAELWQRWQGSNVEGGVSFSLPTWSNRTWYPGGRTDPKIVKMEAMWPPDLFMERFGGVPSKPEGLVFKEFDPKLHVKPLDALYNPDLPVEIWCDPATRTYSILFVQIQDDEKTVHVLDEIYAKDSIGQKVIPQVVGRKWWKDSCFTGVIDAAGTRRMGANKSQIEVWTDVLKEMGEHPIRWAWREIRDVKLWYDAIHLRLWSPADATPLIYFADTLDSRLTSSGDAQGLLGEMKTHRWATKTDLHAQSSRPIKRNEDALSAVGYGLFYHFGPVVKRSLPNVRKRKPYF